MNHQTNQTQAEVFEAVLCAEGSRCPRAELERRFKQLTPLTLSDALATLLAEGVLVEEHDTLRVPIAAQDAGVPVVEPLAAVVNYVLVANSGQLTVEQVCEEVERDPAVVSEHREVVLALVLVAYCGLARRDDEGRWSPTRAALWAERLSF
jgi:hypothetical protein